MDEDRTLQVFDSIVDEDNTFYYLDFIRNAVNSQSDFDKFRDRLFRAAENPEDFEFYHIDLRLEELEPFLRRKDEVISSRQSLMEECRSVIRSHLPLPLWRSIDSLPLPTKVKDYLKLKYMYV